MDVFCLEVAVDGIATFLEAYTAEEEAELRLLSFVHDEWNSEMMGRSPEGIPGKELIKIFFDEMEEYHYLIHRLPVKGIKPVPEMADPYAGMEPVALSDLEVKILQSCIGLVSALDLRKYMHQAGLLPTQDYGTAAVQKHQANLIKRLG